VRGDRGRPARRARDATLKKKKEDLVNATALSLTAGNRFFDAGPRDARPTTSEATGSSPSLATSSRAGAAGSFLPFCQLCGTKLPTLRADAVGCPWCGAELVRSDGTRATCSRARPWLHAAASALFPGAGQAWNGQPGKAVFALLTFWLVVPWIWSVVDAWWVARKRSLASPTPATA
jgi:predicted RNA-binding Zn-ribbon protein involved in translation (DUF1610 family)